MSSAEMTIGDPDRLMKSTLDQTIARDRPRLRNFIRSRVLSAEDAEDILQDVFFEFIQSYRLLKPAEQASAWLFRVAHNRITDLFRRRKSVSLNQPAAADADDADTPTLEDLLPSPDAGPDAVFARNLLYDALDAAIEELPPQQRAVLLAHEFEGKSFKQMAAETGTPINTLLARKRYAILHLRQRLEDFTDSVSKEPL